MNIQNAFFLTDAGELRRTGNNWVCAFLGLAAASILGYMLLGEFVVNFLYTFHVPCTYLYTGSRVCLCVCVCACGSVQTNCIVALELCLLLMDVVYLVKCACTCKLPMYSNSL
jgi:hypothetical protein